MVNHTQPVSLKHYPRIQRQPELPFATIPDAHHGAVRLADDFGLLQQADIRYPQDRGPGFISGGQVHDRAAGPVHWGASPTSHVPEMSSPQQR